MTEPDFSLRAIEFFNRPLVYVWRRDKLILYVGQSSRGLIRLSRHDVINKKEPVKPEDVFDIYYTSNPEGLEKVLILELKPKYNKIESLKSKGYRLINCCVCKLEFLSDNEFRLVCSNCIGSGKYNPEQSIINYQKEKEENPKEFKILSKKEIPSKWYKRECIKCKVEFQDKYNLVNTCDNCTGN